MSTATRPLCFEHCNQAPATVTVTGLAQLVGVTQLGMAFFSGESFAAAVTTVEHTYGAIAFYLP